MEILYEDKYILAVIKEAGMPVQRDKSGSPSLEEEAEKHCLNKCHIITRLDRPVGGIVLMAKDSKTAALLSSMVQEGKAEKIYSAVVCGTPNEGGRLENYIFKNGRTNTSKIVNRGSMGAKRAALEYELLKKNKAIALLKIRLETGRHHQIRVQLAHAGFPIYGDTKYNPKFIHKRNVTPALFARELKFTHPITGEELNIKAREDKSELLYNRLAKEEI